MCIRDRSPRLAFQPGLSAFRFSAPFPRLKVAKNSPLLHDSCLLYTSDAADERSSVDLGGRRIIKKKKTSDADDQLSNVNIEDSHKLKK